MFRCASRLATANGPEDGLRSELMRFGIRRE